tara:strand:+ start:171 stop:1352 length:1182 start_codon:yes stop_codon:yes gene_type:complete
MSTKIRGFIPYGKQYINLKDIFSVIRALKSDYLTQGPRIDKFQEEFSNKIQAKYSVAVNSATSALHIACKALNLQENDELWTSPITFVASANCARYCGANVDFIDINKDTGLIDLNFLESKLKIANLKKKLPKIIVPVHLGGVSCDMDGLGSLSEKYGFKIIEDASHAIGGKYNNEPIGSCRHSKITIFSFHPVKIITTGEGGIATTNDISLAERMLKLRSHGITKLKKDFKFNSPGDWYYEQQELGFNYRITDIQAALGLSQLSRLDEIIKKRKKIFDYYEKEFKHSSISMQKIPKNCSSSYHLAIAQFQKINSKKYHDIFSYLREANIGVQLHYYPVHLQPYYRDLGFKKGDFPSSEEYSSKSLSLPIFPTLKIRDQKYITQKALNAVLGL